jgi:hypothetical protein
MTYARIRNSSRPLSFTSMATVPRPVSAHGQDRVLVCAGGPEQVQERGIFGDSDVWADHGSGIFRETVHEPIAAVHEIEENAHTWERLTG